MPENLKCPCKGCTAETEAPRKGGYNVGLFEKESGWGPVFDQALGLGVLWVCPKHYQEAQGLVHRLVEICGTDTFSIATLLPRRSKTGGGS